MMMNMKLILSQSNQNDPKRQHTEQELVAALLMRDRIEVILVQDAAQLEIASTDALCIQGIRGDMLVAAWHPIVDCIEHLRRLGIIGRFDGDATITPDLPIALPSGHYDAMQRRIVCLNLSDIVGPANARQQILTLLRDEKRNDIEIPPDTPSAPSNTRPTQPTRAMPRRSGTPPSADELDLLIDKIDESNL